MSILLQIYIWGDKLQRRMCTKCCAPYRFIYFVNLATYKVVGRTKMAVIEIESLTLKVRYRAWL